MRRDRYDRSRIDTNQKEIVAALLKIPGVKIELNHDDILLGYKKKTYWFEIKKETIYKKDNELKKDMLKPKQLKLMSEWTGHYSVVWTLDQILNEIGISGKS